MISWSIFNILQLLVDGVTKCWICAIFVIWVILKFSRKVKFVGENGISVKLVCFEPNSPSHNKIRVVGFLWKIYQTHQYLKIFKISKIGMTPPPNITVVQNGVTSVNSQFFPNILKFQQDLLYLMSQKFLFWCRTQIRAFTSKVISKYPKFHTKNWY